MMPSPFDLIILTASNDAQALGYRVQLSRRGLTPEGETPCEVIADPKGARVGSGAATLLAMAHAMRAFGKTGKTAEPAVPFAGKRVLILHSGGDSRRLPAYAAHGKIFAPLPSVTGAPLALFDLILKDLEGLKLPSEGGVLVAAGDLLLNVSRKPPTLQTSGVTGVACRGDAARASRHGVYVVDAKSRVRDFLQKPTREFAKRRGAVARDGSLLIDTGLVHIGAVAAAAWMERCGAVPGRAKPLAGSLLADITGAKCPMVDLYEHVLMALVPGRSTTEYLAGLLKPPQSAAESAWLARLREALLPVKFRSSVADSCDFVHLGTTQEFLRETFRIVPTPPGLEIAPRTLVYNSRDVSVESDGSDTVIVEGCNSARLSGAIRLRGPSLVVGVPYAATARVNLPKGVGLVCLPIGADKWAAAAFGVEDDCKTPIERGGTWCNTPLSSNLKAINISEELLWPDAGERSLWTARLWIVGSADESISAAVHMANGCVPPGSWKNAPKESFATLMQCVNHEQLTRPQLVDDLPEFLGGSIVADGGVRGRFIDAHARIARMSSGAQRSAAERNLEWELSKRHDPLTRARLAAALEFLRGRGRSRTAGCSASAMAEQGVREAVSRGFELPHRPPTPAILPGQHVWATSPARIDLAGGWSDTPPICNAYGGKVVNAAITLNGAAPIQAVATLRPDSRTLRITSIDLGRTVEVASTADALDFRNPGDWSALPKAALVLCGIAPGSPAADFSRWIKRFGAGVDLTIFAALPKGSGLGTSSILGATILSALDRVVGSAFDRDSLCRRASILEQMMSTAGGWQDQAGGITPGTKFLETLPGLDQTPSITTLGLPRGVLERSLLYYTGYTRLAKNILQGIVTRFLLGHSATHATVEALRNNADNMKRAADAQDASGFVQEVARYGQLKRTIDAGSITPAIERMVKPIARHLDAYELTGAGGGGFMFMIAKSPRDAARIRRALEARPPNETARFYRFAIDEVGLCVRVL
ncbi:MAG: hypothetical protein JSR77_16365 [Planctomycetes bacterium]|nr:hypothetical protein [Planctomycetota bacterium]